MAGKTMCLEQEKDRKRHLCNPSWAPSAHRSVVRIQAGLRADRVKNQCWPFKVCAFPWIT